MTDKQLEELIQNINFINTTMQWDYITNCMDILGIKTTRFDSKGDELRELCIEKIIRKTESILTEKQKEKFYSSILGYYLTFTSNNDVKKNYIYQNRENLIYMDGEVSELYARIVISIHDDDYKLDFLRYYEKNLDSEWRLKLIISLDSDETKISYISEFIISDYSEYYLDKFILSIKDDSLKIKLFHQYEEKLEDTLSYFDLIVSCSQEEIKINYVREHSSDLKSPQIRKLISSLKEDDSLLTLWNFAESKDKVVIIYFLKSTDRKMECFEKLNSELTNQNLRSLFCIEDTLFELSDEQIKKIAFEYINIPISAKDFAKNTKDEELILQILKLRGKKADAKYIRVNNLLSSNLVYENLDVFLELEQVENKEQVKSCIQKMYPNNNDIVHTIDWQLLTDKYISTLGIEKLNLFGSYKNLTYCLIDFTDEQYKLFYRSLNYYIEKNPNVDWNYAAYQILSEVHFSGVDKKNIEQYIDDYQNINMDSLLRILLDGDNYGITSSDDINNYELRVEEKCKELIQSHNISAMKEAIFLKFFDSSIMINPLRGFREQLRHTMIDIYYLYGTDIEKIDNPELKELFSFLGKIIESQSEEELVEIYNSQREFNRMDIYSLEVLLKKELLKLYNKQLLQLKDLKVGEDGVLEAGTDFSMIVTSVGAYVENSPSNYKEDWNRPSLASQHFCTSYIRNDMLGTAPIPHFMYGFCSMSENSLLLSGATDIYSSGAAFISKAYNAEMYYGPDSQINNTYKAKYHYNEMDFRRIQNGVRKQPDYIVVFRRDGLVENLDEAKLASEQWGGLPIVVVDVQLCLESERNKLEQMIREFMNEPTLERYKQIEIKINNNRVTDDTFANNIPLEELYKLVGEEVSNEKTI